MKEDSNEWTLYILLAGIASFIGILGSKFLFGIIAENITINIRARLYEAILQKHMGWFDEKENSAGVMIAVLGREV